MEKLIEISGNDSDLYIQKAHFNEIWNIKDITEDREKFKTRCLAIMNEEFDKNAPPHDFSRDRVNFINNYCNEISICLGIESRNNLFTDFDKKDIYRYLCSLNMKNNKDFEIFMFWIQLTMNYNYDDFIKNETVAKRFAEALKLSNIKAKIILNDNCFNIYPLDIEFLDKSLVFDVLSWLNNFKESKKLFNEAIKLERNENNYRHIVDDLRLCLELFLKKLLNNSLSLEKQESSLGIFLKKNNISKEINNLYWCLLDYYSKYNNNHVKHDNSIYEKEIDYLIYLTGTFLRFLLLINEDKKDFIN